MHFIHHSTFYQGFYCIKIKQTLEADDPKYLMALKYNNEKLPNVTDKTIKKLKKIIIIQIH